MKVSIVTVCLNAESYIAQAIESVLGQSYPDFEYLLIDGGSTDRTVEIIRGYATDHRLRWVSEPDQGIADAMNKGARLATGEVVAHLNADDYYADADVLLRVTERFKQNPKVDWLTAGFDFVAADRTRIRSVRVRRYSRRRLIRGNILLHPSTFIRRDLLFRAGAFDTALSYCMDYDLFLRLADISPPLLVDEQLSCFRVHDDSRTVTESEKSHAEEFRVRERYLARHGIGTLFYRLDYQLKKCLNRWLYKRLRAGNDRCSARKV